MSPDEVPLSGGDVTEGVVRIGETVRRPRGLWSESVAAYLRHLESVGFDGAPRHLRIDEQGRDVLDFVAGEVPSRPVVESWAASEDALVSVARLLRRLHDASAGFVPPRDAIWFGQDLHVECLRRHGSVGPTDRLSQRLRLRSACAAAVSRIADPRRKPVPGYRMRANAEQRGGGWADMWEEGIGERILRGRAWLIEQRSVLDASS